MERFSRLAVVSMRDYGRDQPAGAILPRVPVGVVHAASLGCVASGEYQALSSLTPAGLRRLPGRLRDAGIFVIVVGNYLVAAFYVASGATACNSGL